MVFKEDKILIVNAIGSDTRFYVIREKGPDAVIKIIHGHWYKEKGVLTRAEVRFIEEELIQKQQEYATGNPIGGDSQKESMQVFLPGHFSQ